MAKKDSSKLPVVVVYNHKGYNNNDTLVWKKTHNTFENKGEALKWIANQSSLETPNCKNFVLHELSEGKEIKVKLVIEEV